MSLSDDDLVSTQHCVQSRTPVTAVGWQSLSDDTSVPREPTSCCAEDIPGYQILYELGRGGMGVVYKARQVKLDRPVALKVILSGAHSTVLDRMRFRKEAEAVAQLRHPNIVQVFDVGEHQGRAYIAFEFVEGPTLRAWQHHRPLDAQTAAQVVAQVARAVQHAHDQGILHRDLKPANVLMSAERGARSAEPKTDPSGSQSSELRTPRSALLPKVMDFGLAKRIDGDLSLTETGVACGTPNYMAPEQARGGKEPLGPGVDIYGLGAVLYELLSGQAPFAGLGPIEVLTLVLDGAPVSVRTLVPKLPRDLAVIVEKCLEKTPGRRYPTAAALADDLERFLRSEPILARPVGELERIVRWGKRYPAATMLIVVLAGMLAASVWFSVALWTMTAAERQARVEAEEAKREAVLAHDQERAAKNEADEYHEIARSAVEKVMSDLALDPRFKEGDYIELRWQLLYDTQEYYRRFLEKQSDDPKVQSAQALALRRIGYLEASTFDRDEGAKKYTRSVELYRDLCERFPQESIYQARLAEVLIAYGNLLAGTKDAPRGLAYLREAQTLLAPLVRDDPENELFLAEYVRSHVFLSPYLTGDHTAEGFANDQRGLELALTLARDHLRPLLVPIGEIPIGSNGKPIKTMGKMMMRSPNLGEGLNLPLDNPEYWRYVGMLNQSLARRHLRAGELDVAECYFLDSLQTRELVCQLPSNGTRMRHELSVTALEYANLLSRTGRADAAEPHLHRAAEILSIIIVDAPRVLGYRADYARVHLELARREAARNRPRDAIELCDRAIEQNGVVVKHMPQSAEALAIDRELKELRAKSVTAVRARN